MKRFARVVLVGFAFGVAAAEGLTAQELERAFLEPPATARPHTWWHWMNGNVTAEGITADLESMARVGIGGAQIFNVSEAIPDGPAPFMSPQWLELVRHAAEEAERLGIELCLHNCAGWSSSGGPWITPEHAMQILVTSEVRVKGPVSFDDVLPRPEMREGYYRDIAVLAFPTPADETRIEGIRAKAGFEARYAIQPEVRSLPAGATIALDRVTDLTAKLVGEDPATRRLSWRVPEGDWTILRIGHTPTGKTNHPSPEAGRGLECDKLSSEALDLHWQKGVQPVLDAVGPLAGKVLNNSLIDSYEVGCNNWTPLFREEFRRRRGYDLWRWLPALTGRVVESGERSERFLWDFRRTIADLFDDHYFGRFADLCHERGLLTSVEPYDGPFECLSAAEKADVVMGEFWVGSGESSSVKLAACVGHTHGIRWIGAESFTATPDRGRWQNHPASLKALGDLIWCAGINRFIFHRFAHQPWPDVFPGMTMGQWGTHFDRTNAWWEPGRAWIEYLARSQSMLQSGEFVADVLFFGGEAAPNGAVHRPALKALGYDYDAIGTDLVGALTVKGGHVALPSGMSYRLLVLPDTPFMTPALARKMRELVVAGATVLGPKPVKSPSLEGWPACDTEVAAIGAEVWGADADAREHASGAGRVLWDQPVDSALAALEVEPDCTFHPAEAKAAFIHRRIDGADVYFVSNQVERAVTLDASFRVAGRLPELWSSEQGTIQPAPFWHPAGDRTIVTLSLAPAGSTFVVFRTPAPKDSDSFVSIRREGGSPPMRAAKPNQLEIVKAEYGVLSPTPHGCVDVTKELDALVNDDRLRVVASNSLAGDPAVNIVKKLWVEYEQGGEVKLAKVRENEVLTLPPAGAPSGALHVRRALYGDFRDDMPGLPERAVIDVTERLAAEVSGGELHVLVRNSLAGEDPAYLTPKQLRVDYVLNGRPGSLTVNEGAPLDLPVVEWLPMPFEPSLRIDGDRAWLLVYGGGRYVLEKASGAVRDLGPLPEDGDGWGELNGQWTVSFPPGRSAPEEIVLDELISWPDSDVPGVKYFSGTATYRRKFDSQGLAFVPGAKPRNDGHRLILDLGRVEVIAEVHVNGRDLGVLWKEPYRIDITEALLPGENELEILVTNLWPNRLIGDEQEPPDVEWNGKPLREWPEWFVKHEPRPSPGRVTFTTWHHWTKNDPLLPSGLIGPVRLVPALEYTVR